VRFKPVSGRGDQAAGLVWRYKDRNNYCIVRANALENNVVLYKVQNGRRTDLPTSGRQVGSVDISGDTDDLFFDLARKRLYVSFGGGFAPRRRRQAVAFAIGSVSRFSVGHASGPGAVPPLTFRCNPGY
jgi:hypothetical protein